MADEETTHRPGEEDLVFALGSSRRTTAEQAERDLSSLWSATGEEADARGGPGVLRVQELNLIVHAATRDVSDRVGQIAGHIAGCHPARVIVLLEETQGGRSEEELDAWITAACYRSREGDRQICWEQVNVLAGGADPAQIQGATASLLVPDVPVMLWWPGAVAVGSSLFKGLASLSDRLIFDSSSMGRLRADWGALRTTMRSKERNWSTADLAWHRLRPWQELIAEPFDDPGRLDFLKEAEEVIISYEADVDHTVKSGGTSSAVARSLLLAGWLGGRLGWMPDGGGWSRDGADLRAAFRRPAGKGPVALRLVPVHDSPCLFGGVVEFTMRSRHGGGSPQALVVTRREGSCACASWFWSEGREDLVRTLEMPIPEEDHLLCEALEAGPGDQVYEEAFSLATDLAVLPGGKLLAAE